MYTGVRVEQETIEGVELGLIVLLSVIAFVLLFLCGWVVYGNGGILDNVSIVTEISDRSAESEVIMVKV